MHVSSQRMTSPLAVVAALSGTTSATVTGAGLPFESWKMYSPAAVSIFVTTSGMDSAEPSAAQDLPSRNRKTTSFSYTASTS